MVPEPPVVNISRSIACGDLPSIITAALTPDATVSRHVLILGIMPPVIILSFIIDSAFVTEILAINFLSESKTPSTSVSNNILSAYKELAIAPAAVSAFIL